MSSIAQKLDYDQYTTDDGLPSNTVYEIVQDSTGLLWMGTENGLVSFDGESFLRFSDPRLKDNDILELEISKDGHVTFINSGNQYCRIEGQNVIISDINEGLYAKLITSKLNDFIIAGSVENSLLRYSNGIEPACSGPFLGYGLDSCRNLIIYTTKRLIDKYKHSYSNPLDLTLVKIDSLIAKGGYNAIFKHNNHNYIVSRLRVSEFKFDFFNELLELFITSVLNLEKASFVSHLAGLIEINDNNVITNHFPKFKVNQLFTDLEGNVWMTTNNDGLLKLNINEFVVPIDENLVSEISEFVWHDNALLVLTTKGLVVYNSNLELIQEFGEETYRRKQLFVNDQWIYVFGDQNCQLYELVDNRIKLSKVLRTEQGFTLVLAESNNYVYRASRREIRKTKKSELIDAIDSVGSQIIIRIDKTNVLLAIDDENLLIGTDNGLYRFLDSDSDHVLVNNVIGAQNVSSMQLDLEGNVWVGTANNGIYRLDEKDTNIGSKLSISCLKSNVVNDIFIYEEFLFITTPRGIIRYNTISEDCASISEYEGLLKRNVENVFVKSLDSIFISQNKSISMIDNALFDEQLYIPGLNLQRSFINNMIYNGNINGAEFNYTSNNIELKYDFNIFREIDSKSIKFRINDNSNWSISSEGVVRLTSLSPGDYKIETKGIYSINRETEPHVLLFTILPPWWQTVWARLLGLLSVLLSSYMYVTIRSSRIKKEEAAKRDNLEKLETSRREYLQQIYKVKDQALQLQMNPHFIFNAMNAIQSFITSGKEKDATVYLAKFAKLIRRIFEYSNTNLISMEAEIEFVNLYIELEQLRFKNRISCSIHVSESIDIEKDILRVPPLLIQPLIENSFKHGLFHKLNGGELRISYDLEDDTIVAVIEDNGIGRSASRELQGENYDKERHSGMKNITQRLEIFKFNMPEHENSLVVEDLFCDGKPSGTKTTIKVTIDENR